MLVIDALREALGEIRRMPPVAVVGLVVMVAAGALDVVLHLGGAGHFEHHSLVSEHLAHGLGVAGMVLVLAGVATHGARRQLRQRAARTGGFDRNAHR